MTVGGEELGSKKVWKPPAAGIFTQSGRPSARLVVFMQATVQSSL
jgi:hypothetical protein